MKTTVTVQPEDPKFKPLTLTIQVNNEQELANLWARTNLTNHMAKDLQSMIENKTKVKPSDVMNVCSELHHVVDAEMRKAGLLSGFSDFATVKIYPDFNFDPFFGRVKRQL